MAEYIEREAAMHIAFKSTFFSDALMEEMKAIPAADVATVRHGKWLPTTKWWQGGSAWKQCSECGILHLGKSNFCPNCGAKMDLEG